MELKVNAVAIPEAITFNYEELKAELLQKVSAYETMVYTEDQIKEAKADRANLNRLKKALNDERIKREKEYMQPFNQFKAQISEIISIIDKPVTVIDRQIKAAEEQQKQEKLQKIRECYAETITNKASLIDAGIKLEQFFDDKWLNSSVSMKSIQEAIIAKLDQIENDLAVVRGLPSYAFEAEQEYLASMDLAKSIGYTHRLQAIAEMKAAHEAEQAKKEETKQPESVNYGSSKSEITVNEPSRQWIGFQAFLSVDEAKALGQFMKDNGIKYKKG